MRVTQIKRLALFALACFFGLPPLGPARACSIPVFRYALERWVPEPYEALVFHGGPLKQDEKRAVDRLKELGRTDSPDASIVVRTVDLAGPSDAKVLEFRKTRPDARIPWIVLRYPSRYEIAADAWSGPLNMDTVNALPDSPVRREVCRRILDGESAVFVFLASGNSVKDDPAFKALSEELDKQQKTLELPVPQEGSWGDDRYDRQGSPELRLAFSVVRLSRSDPGEQVLLRTLLSLDESLKTRVEPVVFPFYGRGRMLGAVIGADITADEIGSVCRFLVGSCSCTVKEQNPGVDILMGVDWDKGLTDRGSAPSAPQAPLVGISEFASAAKGDVPAETVQRGKVLRNIGIAFVGGLVLVMLAWPILSRRKKN